jgi:hypothetical protein
MEFIASLVESLAWPAALVTVVLIFRHRLRAVTSRSVV